MSEYIPWDALPDMPGMPGYISEGFANISEQFTTMSGGVLTFFLTIDYLGYLYLFIDTIGWVSVIRNKNSYKF